MNKPKYTTAEIIFIVFYTVYPFYIFYLLTSDDGVFHFESIESFIVPLIPSLISWALMISYIILRHKLLNSILILIGTLLFHLAIIYLLFYFLETEPYSKEKLVAFAGIFCSIFILFQKLVFQIKSVSR